MKLQPCNLAFVISLAIGSVVGLVPQTAHADFVQGIRGSSCVAANLAAASSLRFSPLFVENLSATAQYVTCNVPSWSGSFQLSPVSYGIRFYNNGDVTGNVICTSVFDGTPFFGTFGINSNTLSLEIAAGSRDTLTFADADVTPRRGFLDTASALAISCRLPPGMRLERMNVNEKSYEPVWE